MTDLRALIRGRVRHLVGSGEVDLTRPPGDDGLFGPGSPAWRIHGDFTAMMIGGLSSLLLQMLHPAALAGVWDHSNFRQDMRGRLRRTAQFISGTTYGSTEQAGRLIDHVRAIHGRVRGVLPEGTPYSADDPVLLTWVHVAEVSSFLAAYRRHRRPDMSPAEQDRYLAEVAQIAERLGAERVPASRREVADYLTEVRPRLRADARTREVAAAMLDQPAPSPAFAPASALMMEAGKDLLPAWAADMHGFRPLPRPIVTAGMTGLGEVLRWALRDGSEQRARRRTASDSFNSRPVML
jgi:uncharacterized protein (DUF2236 family)